MDRSGWKMLIKIGWWSGSWVGECFFWYWLTRTNGHRMIVVVVVSSRIKLPVREIGYPLYSWQLTDWWTRPWPLSKVVFWYYYHHHNHFTALFPRPPGRAGDRRGLLDFMMQGKINRGGHTDHPAGRHSIRTNQCPPPPSTHFLQAGCPSCCPTNSVKALILPYFLE